MSASPEPPRLPKPAGAVRAFWARNPRLADALLAGLCALWSFESNAGLQIPQPVDVRWAVVCLVVAATMLVRRSQPWWALTAVAFGGAMSTGHFIGVALACALYALAAYRSTRDAVLGAVLAVTALTVPAIPHGDPAEWRSKAIIYAVIAVIAIFPGANVRTRRRYLQALLDRTVQLAREKEQEGRLAAIRERTRIAHDLHDIVAHSLTVMVRLADGAAAVADSDPHRARSASERIGGIGRDAMVDMRRLLGVLRDGGEDEPAIQDLDALAGTFRGAGLPVALRRQGPEPTDRSVRTAVFRTVQEALTNALRYAENAQRVLVAVDYRADPIRIEVTDDGRGTGPAPSVGTRQGLVALRERLALYGGTVDAGPRPAHGWSVRATLPQPSKDTDG
ncbi:sensor histidine kinase [Virgisporangium aliadipatigenens]|uniref:sensor histidine kinase n=1 Tax=Virgisporangium aliadipatigenens TaxID=741659 RepID=UPI00194297B0|nr:sensor histidine kinase [Virgisporangium aliadipatigenens]